MDRVVKLMCAAAVSIGVFAACNKNAGGVKVNSPRDLKGGADKTKKQDTAKDKEEAVDTSKLSEKDKAEVDRVAKDMKALRPLFRDAGSLISDLRPYLKDPKDTTTDSSTQNFNILKMISWILEKNFNGKGLPFKVNENDKAECTLGYSGVKADSDSQYSILFAPCNAKDDVKVIAKLMHSGNYWEVFFNIGNLSGNPKNMMGNLMQIWNAKDGSGAPIESKCRLDSIKKSSVGHLGMMICSNIGYDVSATSYILIQKLEFYHPIAIADQRPPVVVDFTKFESTNNEKPKVAFTAAGKDDFELGNFLVELTNAAPEEDLAAQAKLSAETAAKELLNKREEERKAKAAAGSTDNPQADNTQNGSAQSDPTAQQGDPQVGVQQQNSNPQDPNQSQQEQDPSQHPSRPRDQ